MLPEGIGEGKWLHVSSLAWRLFLLSVCREETGSRVRRRFLEAQGVSTTEPAHLELHGDVLLVLWRGVARLVVGEVVGRARVDDGRLRRRPVHLVAVGEGQRRQQGREEEAGRAHGEQLEQSEGWEGKREEGRGKREEGRGKREEGRGKGEHSERLAARLLPGASRGRQGLDAVTFPRQRAAAASWPSAQQRVRCCSPSPSQSPHSVHSPQSEEDEGTERVHYTCAARSRYSQSVWQAPEPSLGQSRVSVFFLPSCSCWGSGSSARQVYLNLCSCLDPS
ncbi:hypothetical protein EYF80_037195 [Liparis tanakae]|uniref:Uncharacterized protein n=1 Tax=Liparis tanakae TaxID=230148 RepID=A0A4Z2GGF1_9TELE|nr:hypothetical protein EYF80_037195 [Liparis tanakae]